MRPKKKLLIVDASLKDFKSHHFQYIQDIRRGAEQCGWKVEILGPRKIDPAVKRALRVRNWLPGEGAFETSASWSLLRPVFRICSIAWSNGRLAWVLRAYLQKTRCRPDLILGTTATLNNVLGFWLGTAGMEQAFGRLALIFPHLVGHYTSDFQQWLRPRKLGFYACWIGLFRNACRRDKTRLTVESPKMREMYGQFTGLPYQVVEHVVEFPALNLEQIRRGNRQPGSPLRLACFGPARYDKGLDVLQKALLALRQESPEPDYTCTIQWQEPYCLPDGTCIGPDPQLQDRAGFEWIRSYFGTETYFRHLVSTDLMVLPYRRGFYYAKLSRVAIDAAICGIPFIYPCGTWLEEYANDWGIGIGFMPEDPVSLAAAIRLGLRDYQRWKASSMAAATSAEMRHSTRELLRVLEADI